MDLSLHHSLKWVHWPWPFLEPRENRDNRTKLTVPTARQSLVLVWVSGPSTVTYFRGQRGWCFPMFRDLPLNDNIKFSTSNTLVPAFFSGQTHRCIEFSSGSDWSQYFKFMLLVQFSDNTFSLEETCNTCYHHRSK